MYVCIVSRLNSFIFQHMGQIRIAKRQTTTTLIQVTVKDPTTLQLLKVQGILIPLSEHLLTNIQKCIGRGC